MDADCGGKLGHLLDDRALAEDVGVEPGRFVGGAVAPDGGSDELIHADTVSRRAKGSLIYNILLDDINVELPSMLLDDRNLRGYLLMELKLR